ncbi:Transcription initiation factor TFIID subunit 12 [Aspergillus nanangensis]|uniref:Transcription initiation factor TFIID subunit 12 n=1 Tax=Aspergillus nanangensis TaxID=2582783 RepID=A0AAD4GSG3_ASPNN|nr:Transcription initiation factor TFIID subunit 12 [Aspergillus nanangensis]
MGPQTSNLIRTDQVQKLPHLNEQQKNQHTQVVRNFWEILNNRDPQSTEYQTAHTRLATISQNLMKGMRAFQQNRQMQQQQQLQAAAVVQQGQPIPRPQSVNPQSFQQLFPQVQQKVNSLNFFLPPSISNEQAQGWLPEAKLRYGIALQKQEVGRARVNEIRNQFSQRQTAGNMTQEDVQEFKSRQMAAEKLYREGGEFLTKFKEQQENFKAQHQQRAGVPVNAGAPPPTGAPPPAAGVGADGRPTNAPGPIAPGQAPTPAPHTITSAVSAARNQAHQTAMSPSTSQQGQTPTAQGSGATPTAPTMPQQQQQPQPPPPQQQQQQPPPPPPQQSQQMPMQQGTPGSQVTFTQAPVPGVDVPTPTQTPQPLNVQGPPRPLSQQAAMAQAAQNYSNNNAANNSAMTQQQQQAMTQPAANTHAHPMSNRSSENNARNINMAIPKNLNVPPPEPVTMSPARPSLSGGPSHGAMGMMGQPAIQKHPGYVLEGEGQRVLSKKMLDILVRQVTGGGEGEGLTPDAEEFILQMADDFVDDVITAACRLAKLRPSSTLEIRDIQLVLERNYNMRISGFSTDDLRTVKKPQPTQSWTQKMSAIQAAKVTQGKAE